MSVVPDLREELNRKSLDTCEWLLKSLQAAKITKEQFSVGIDALFMATSGLTDDDIIEMITNADALVKDLRNVVKAHFCKNSHIFTMILPVGECDLHIQKREDGNIYSEETKTFSSPAAALDALEKMSARCRMMGFSEL